MNAIYIIDSLILWWEFGGILSYECVGAPVAPPYAIYIRSWNLWYDFVERKDSLEWSIWESQSTGRESVRISYDCHGSPVKDSRSKVAHCAPILMANQEISTQRDVAGEPRVNEPRRFCTDWTATSWPGVATIQVVAAMSSRFCVTHSNVALGKKVTGEKLA